MSVWESHARGDILRLNASHLTFPSGVVVASSANSEELRSSVLVEFDHPVHQSFECHTVSSRDADCCSVPHLVVSLALLKRLHSSFCPDRITRSPFQ